MTTPLDDLVAHETSEQCVCGPLPIPVITGRGDQFAITVHRRLDGQDAPVWLEELPAD